MALKNRKNGLLNLGQELSRFEMKSIVGGGAQTICTGGTYNIGCSPSYCSGAGHGSFVDCNPSCSPNCPGQGGGTNPGGPTTPPPSGNYTQCTGGTYAIGCSPSYCSGAGHGSFVSCHN